MINKIKDQDYLWKSLDIVSLYQLIKRRDSQNAFKHIFVIKIFFYCVKVRTTFIRLLFEEILFTTTYLVFIRVATLQGTFY